MKINWKLRLRNKTTLTALVASAISLAYIVLGIFDIVPGVTQSQLTDLAAAALNALVLLGAGTAAEDPRFGKPMHNENVVFNEDILTRGAALHAFSALKWLAGE